MNSRTRCSLLLTVLGMNFLFVIGPPAVVQGAFYNLSYGNFVCEDLLGGREVDPGDGPRRCISPYPPFAPFPLNSYDTLNISDFNYVLQLEQTPFWTQGVINNNGIIYNYGIIENSGTINNYGYIFNEGTINNFGTINNIGPEAIINNFGTIFGADPGNIVNSEESTINNYCGGRIDSFYSGAPINNILQSSEVCDGLDNDCDGMIDEAPASSSCNDGQYCNGVESCFHPTYPHDCSIWFIDCCQPGTPVDCSGLMDQCNEGVCDESIDECIKQPCADGTPCDDGDPNTINDVCTNGVCRGEPPGEAPLFSDALGILPVAAIAVALVILRQRRKRPPMN